MPGILTGCQTLKTKRQRERRRRKEEARIFVISAQAKSLPRFTAINCDCISKTCPAISLIESLSENHLLSGMERISVALTGYITA